MRDTTDEADEGNDATEAFDDQLTRVDGKQQPRQQALAALSVPRLLVGKQDPPQTRYELRDMLGEGRTGQVYLAWDKDLNREVALKIVRDASSEDRELFMQEARVSAALGHPNIPPLYDAGESNGGTLYLSMWPVPGRSLGELIRNALHARLPEAMPVESAIETMLKLCDAVAYVHSRGIIHQDIKPDNVVLGDYGEVMLIDWGAATVSESSPSRSNVVIGTPAYMAPERLRGDAPNPRSDIYALGATLFHLVLLRKPIVEKNESRFWQRKRAGEIDLPTTDELFRVPRPLLGIAIKAMSAEPADRYSSVSEFAQALRDCHSGRSFWAAPVVIETFTDDSYLERWACVYSDSFRREDGHLVSQADLGALLLYKQRLAAGVAIEFEGEIQDGSRPGDLSVIWTDDNLLEGGLHWPKPEHVWSLQIGAFTNLMAGVYQGMIECVAGRPLSIAVGRKYRIRAEINERHLRLLLDGELIAEYQDLFPISSGYIGLYAYYPGKAFSNVRLYERNFPERISPTAIGDAFFGCKYYAQAAEQYARVAQLLPMTKVADEATYKQGLALLSAGDMEQSEAIWQKLRDNTWRGRVVLHHTDAAFEATKHIEVVTSLRDTLLRIPELRATAINRWVKYVTHLCNSDISSLPIYQSLRDELFADHSQSASAAAAAEIALGHWLDVCTRFPDQHIQFSLACNLLGHFHVVAERYASIPWLGDLAKLRLNCSSTEPLSKQFLNNAYLLQGNVEEALRRGAFPEALLVAGRFDEIFGDPFLDPEDRAAALRGLGKLDDALALRDARAFAYADAGPDVFSPSFRLSEQLFLLHHFAFRAFFASEFDQYTHYRERASTLPCGAIWLDLWLHRYVLIPLADELAGNVGAFERSLRESALEHGHKWYEKLRYICRFILGELSEDAFMAQPCKLYIKPRLIIARAFRAEFRKKLDDARAAYREYLALPPIERFSDSARGDPVFERWARFRADVTTC